MEIGVEVDVVTGVGMEVKVGVKVRMKAGTEVEGRCGGGGKGRSRGEDRGGVKVKVEVGGQGPDMGGVESEASHMFMLKYCGCCRSSYSSKDGLEGSIQILSFAHIIHLMRFSADFLENVHSLRQLPLNSIGSSLR